MTYVKRPPPNMEEVCKALEIRLRKAGHSSPVQGVEELVMFMKLLMNEEMESEINEAIGPVKFAEHLRGVINSERTRYGFAIVNKTRRKVMYELEIHYSVYEKLLETCKKTGMLKIKEEQNCYVDL